MAADQTVDIDQEVGVQEQQTEHLKCKVDWLEVHSLAVADHSLCASQS